MASKPKLKRCPFCNGKAILSDGYDQMAGPWAQVGCVVCWAKGAPHYSERYFKAQAVKEWNKRAKRRGE